MLYDLRLCQLARALSGRGSRRAKSITITRYYYITSYVLIASGDYYYYP